MQGNIKSISYKLTRVKLIILRFMRIEFITLKDSYETKSKKLKNDLSKTYKVKNKLIET